MPVESGPVSTLSGGVRRWWEDYRARSRAESCGPLWLMCAVCAIGRAWEVKGDDVRIDCVARRRRSWDGGLMLNLLRYAAAPRFVGAAGAAERRTVPCASAIVQLSPMTHLRSAVHASTLPFTRRLILIVDNGRN